MKKIKLIIVCLIAIWLLYEFLFAPRPLSPMESMMQQVPEIIEVFEQSKEHLNVLRDGKFGSRNVRANDALFINDGRGGVPYERWHTIGWLSEEEKEALVFLLTSEELSWNFVYIGSGMVEIRRDERVRVITATLYTQMGPQSDNIEIWHGDASPTDGPVRIPSSYSRDLGDGWTLWVYTVRR